MASPHAPTDTGGQFKPDSLLWLLSITSIITRRQFKFLLAHHSPLPTPICGGVPLQFACRFLLKSLPSKDRIPSCHFRDLVHISRRVVSKIALGHRLRSTAPTLPTFLPLAKLFLMEEHLQTSLHPSVTLFLLLLAVARSQSTRDDVLADFLH